MKALAHPPVPGVPDGRRQAVGRDSPPVRFRPVVRLGKQQAFEVCAALALAESTLANLGRRTEAAYLSRVFDDIEGLLAS